MRFQKGNTEGSKSKGGGTKTKAQVVEEATKKITADALIELANNKVYKQLNNIKDNNLMGFRDTKEMALPITLKSIADKIDLKTDLKIGFDGLFKTPQ